MSNESLILFVLPSLYIHTSFPSSRGEKILAKKRMDMCICGICNTSTVINLFDNDNCDDRVHFDVSHLHVVGG